MYKGRDDLISPEEAEKDVKFRRAFQAAVLGRGQGDLEIWRETVPRRGCVGGS